MQLSPQEAAAALAEIDQARSTMRQVIRAHRGHYHLWIWGATWVAMPLTAEFWGDQAARFFALICLPAGIASAIVGFKQGGQIRLPGSARFLGVMATLFVFAALFPFVLRVTPDVRSIYAYLCLVAMQGYVIGGLWTDSYLTWLGIVVTALVLAGVFLFSAIFWWWMAVCGGGSLIATGFYVRHFWR
jgi:hypothetical protein